MKQYNAMYERNSAWTHACEHGQGICHVMIMIRVQMNNRYIMYFSV